MFVSQILLRKFSQSSICLNAGILYLVWGEIKNPEKGRIKSQRRSGVEALKAENSMIASRIIV